MSGRRVFAIANQKGGVGKTTTAINLAAALSGLGNRVLLVDMDPQGNATTGSGVEKGLAPLSAFDLLMGEAELGGVVVRAHRAGYDLVPADIDLAATDARLFGEDRAEHLLARQLTIDGDYDYVLIDTPPALSLLTLNCLAAADGVVIPVQCEYFALEGLTDLMQTLSKASNAWGSQLEVEGLLRTMYDNRNLLCREISEQLVEHFQDRLYNTAIPRNVRLAEAPSYGLPTRSYDKGCVGAKAYDVFAKEFVARVNGETG